MDQEDTLAQFGFAIINNKAFIFDLHFWGVNTFCKERGLKKNKNGYKEKDVFECVVQRFQLNIAHERKEVPYQYRPEL